MLILRAFIIPLTDRIKTNRFLEVQKGEKKLVAECRKRPEASPLESPPSLGEKRGLRATAQMALRRIASASRKLAQAVAAYSHLACGSLARESVEVRIFTFSLFSM